MTRAGVGWRTLLSDAHRQYTRGNGDALAGSVTYSVLIGLAPVLLIAGTVVGWAGGSRGTVARLVRRAADRTLPSEVGRLVERFADHLEHGWRGGLSVVAAAMVLWASVRTVRAARTAWRAVCGQDNGSGNPIADNLHDLRLAGLTYAALTAAVLAVAAMPTRLSGQVAGALALWGVVALTMRAYPWADEGRPDPRRLVWASAAAAAAIVGLGTLGGWYLERTMPGRTLVYGALATGVAAAVWVALSVRAVLRALSVASVAQRWTSPDPADDRSLWVVVPAYDEAAGIGATLDALAGQSDPAFTLVVVDNASGDGTADVVRRWAAGAPFPVHVLDEPERGTACASDTGMRFAIAHGAGLLARTDADAVPRPDWVANLRRRFARGAEVVCGASVPRADEQPSYAERHLLPAVQRLLAVYGRFRPAHQDPAFLAPYVLCHGHSLAITADVYQRCGGAERTPSEDQDEDVALLNRARRVTPHVVRAEEAVVENSLRRLRAWGARRTLLWYWDRRWRPDRADEVHVR